MTTIYDFEARQMNGTTVPLDRYRGKALLIVNTASACGFTPQFGGLEALHEAYGTKGLAVLGFPCNQFGGQDPGSNDEIASFCQLNYGVTFPMMAKIDVNGPQAASAVQMAHGASAGNPGQQGHQVELHQVPGRQGRPGDQALRPDRQARGHGQGHRGGAGGVRKTGHPYAKGREGITRRTRNKTFKEFLAVDFASFA